MTLTIPKPLLRERITAEVHRRIVAGVYAPGAPMPTEQELASEFKTSRTTISQALAPLQRAGIIDQKPRRGTSVRPIGARPSCQSIRIVFGRGSLNKPEAARIVNSIHSTLSHLNQQSEMCPYDSCDELRANAFVGRCAGAVFLEAFGCEELVRNLEKARLPCVVANLEQDACLTCTWVDHRKTTWAAVRLLAALGHRRIAFLTRPTEAHFYRKALEGFRAGLDEIGVRLDPEWVVMSPASNSASAFQRTRDFMARGATPTAFVAARDYLAAGACAALSEAGIVVGRDVSVVGFDDVSWAQETPFLTTFREPTHELGAVAAEMLVERLISGWRPVEKREIEAPLVLRRSVGLCPGATPTSPNTEMLLLLPNGERPQGLDEKTMARLDVSW